MVLMCLGWWLVRRSQPNLIPMSTPVQFHPRRTEWWKADLVDADTVDLKRDEYEEDVMQGDDEMDSKQGAKWFRKIFYWVV